MKYMECSAKQHLGLQEIFDETIKIALSQKKKPRRSTKRTNNASPDKKDRCVLL